MEVAITGGNSGIGLATARRLVAEGAQTGPWSWRTRNITAAANGPDNVLASCSIRTGRAV